MRRPVLIAASLLLSCGGEEPAVLVDLPEDPGALFAKSDEGAPVATVGDWAISEDDLLAVHPVRSGAGLDESLEVLVDRVVSVQAGLDGDFEPRFDLLLTWRRALARRWITQRFTRDFTPEMIPDQMLRAVWEVKWFLWDHMNTYYVLDAQYICCREKAGLCEEAVTATCRDENLDLMENLLQVFVEEGVVDTVAFTSVTRDFASSHDVPVTVAEYAFQYDHSKPHDQQRGYDQYAESISLAVEDMEVGTFSTVIRSEFGLHIVFLYKFLPEIHKSLADPEVRMEIAEKSYPALQRKEAADTFSSLSRAVEIGFFPEVLEQVIWPEVTGLEQK